MKDLVKQLQDRHRSIMSRLSAITQEQSFLENELNHVEELIKQYDSSSYYYDIIEEETNVTNAINTRQPQSKYKRKKQVRLDHDVLMYYAELVKEFSANAFYDLLCAELDKVPNKATIYAKLKHLHTIGILERTKLRPLTYKFIGEED